MGNTQSSRFTVIDWLDKGPIAPHLDAFKQYLTDQEIVTLQSVRSWLGAEVHPARASGRNRCIAGVEPANRYGRL